MAGLALIIPRQGGSGPIVPSWSPASLGSALHTWYDPGSGADGAQVTSWADASGNGHAATVGAGAVTYDRDGLGGSPALVFNGSSFLRHTLTTSLGATSVTLLINAAATGAATQYLADGLTLANSMGLYRSITGNTFTARRTGGSSAAVSVSPSDGNPHTFVAVFDGASSALHVDDTVVTGVHGTQAIPGITLGANATGANFLTGVIGDVLLVSRALTASEIVDAKAWMKLRRYAA